MRPHHAPVVRQVVVDADVAGAVEHCMVGIVPFNLDCIRQGQSRVLQGVSSGRGPGLS